MGRVGMARSAAAEYMPAAADRVCRAMNKLSTSHCILIGIALGIAILVAMWIVPPVVSFLYGMHAWLYCGDHICRGGW